MQQACLDFRRPMKLCSRFRQIYMFIFAQSHHVSLYCHCPGAPDAITFRVFLIYDSLLTRLEVQLWTALHVSHNVSKAAIPFQSSAILISPSSCLLFYFVTLTAFLLVQQWFPAKVVKFSAVITKTTTNKQMFVCLSLLVLLVYCVFFAFFWRFFFFFSYESLAETLTRGGVSLATWNQFLFLLVIFFLTCKIYVLFDICFFFFFFLFSVPV